MILKRISILNYKNLEQVEIGFSAKLNCFFGQNGMGKTNLLDAVYFLSFCKSSGNPIDSQNIRHEQDFFVIQGFYEAEVGTLALKHPASCKHTCPYSSSEIRKNTAASPIISASCRW